MFCRSNPNRPVLNAIRSTILVVSMGTTALSGCGVSGMHPGVTSVPLPEAMEQDSNKWFAYYQDQFDAYKGAVLPPSDQSSAAVKQGYQRAVVYWGDKVGRAKTNTFLLTLGILVGAPLLIVMSAGGSVGDGLSAQTARP
jgi:hypothetical protein